MPRPGDVEIGANAGTQAFKDYLFKTLELPVLKTTAKNAGHSRPTAGRLEARRSEAECAGTRALYGMRTVRVSTTRRW